MRLARFGSSLRQRLTATRRVWRPGSAYMVMISPGSMLGDDGRGVSRPPPWVKLPGGSIETPASGTVRGEVLHVVGWAATSTGACARVDLTIDGRVVGRARLGLRRPDVAEETALPEALL